MKIPIAILLLLYSFVSAAQAGKLEDSCVNFIYTRKSEEELLKYIDNPCPNDSTCKTDLSRAKSDVQRGKIKFVTGLGMAYGLRQESQLKQLCSYYGLIYDYEVFGCVVEGGQTSGCYLLYMDKIIAQKFGNDFKKNLLRKADSLFAASYPTIYFRQCDTLPRLHDKNISESTSMDVPIDSKLFDQLRTGTYGCYPQVDIGFHIDSAGIPSNYFLSQFIMYDELPFSDEYKTELTNAAIDYLKQFKVWKPGIVLNQKVNSEYNVRIYFTKRTD